MCRPTLDEAVEWRVPIWAPAVESALQRAAVLVPSDANVLEVGYNTGMMACYMARHYGWNLVGYDISEALRIKATKTAKSYGLEDKTDFRVCLPDETLLIEGNYDAVFLKSVLYHISDKSVYRSWLDWLHGILKEEGVLISIENGRGGPLDRIYRKTVRKFRWAHFLLFDRWTEQEFKKRFRHVDVRYFGRYSQFLTPLPKFFIMFRLLEEKLFPPEAKHCFVASVVAQS